MIHVIYNQPVSISSRGINAFIHSSYDCSYPANKQEDCNRGEWYYSYKIFFQLHIASKIFPYEIKYNMYASLPCYLAVDFTYEYGHGIKT